ncbi:metallophosphoesterase [Brevibacillus sp. 179-C 1.1 NHS]|uniref:metallophosphoesterase n=1 Tax=Brevibacillus sp. 179-C 1.1 NHS TaxID=3235177 RepID=UPI0039A08ACE
MTEQKTVNDPHIVPMSRKTFLRKMMKWVGGLLGLGMGTGLYSYGWERKWLDVVRVSITISGLPEGFKGTKLIQFSDVHLGHYFALKELQSVIEVIQSEKPDLICFTGDMVDEVTRPLFAAVPLFSQLQTPLGKYAVLGNHDYRAGEQQSVREGLIASGFEVLDNRHVVVNRNGQQLYIAGVDDILHGVPDLPRAMNNIPAEGTVILLAHEPDFADIASEHPVHLQLSGHSHGGQVRLPFIGHLLAPQYGRKYVQGLYQVGRMALYTNRGLGTTILPVRLFCRPELTVITLQ